MAIKTLVQLTASLLVLTLAGCSAPATDNSTTADNAPDDDHKVSIIWDDNGVPHVSAESHLPGFYGFGWAMMDARSSDVLKLYVLARGQGAEHLGAAYVPSDELIWRMDVPGAAEAWLSAMTEIDQQRVEAFVDGINAWAEANPSRIPEHLRSVLPVRPSDPLAQVYKTLTINFTMFHEFGNGLLVPGFTGHTPGSNAVAVAPGKTTEGHTLFFGNPHLTWTIDHLFTEMHLDFEGYGFYGAAFLGWPFIGVGFNDYSAWSHTVNLVDRIDLYELELDGNRYLFDGVSTELERESKTIKVLGIDGDLEDHQFDIERSIHGPILLRTPGQALAARVGPWQGADIIDQYVDMAQSRSFDDFKVAVSRLQMPLFNLVYGNREGDVYYLYGGQTPDRSTGDWHSWRANQQGDNSEYLWSAHLPFEDLPAIENPSTGFVQSANDAPWYGTYPIALDPNNYNPIISPVGSAGFRSQNLLSFFHRENELTFEAFQSYLLGNSLALADRLEDDIERLNKLPGLSESSREGLNLLTNWDRSANSDSRGTVLFAYWMDQLKTSSDPVFAEPFSIDNAIQTPDGFADPNRAARVLGESVEAVTALYGRPDVKYGDVFRLRYGDHDEPASGTLGDYGALRISWGPFAGSILEGLQTAWPDASAQDQKIPIIGGDSFVFAVEFSDPLKVVGILPYGNSSDRASDYYGDQIQLFSASAFRDIRYAREDIERHSVRSIELSTR